MASIEFIKNRIEGTKKSITKLEAKIARIEKAQATNWEVNPYYYHESDLRSANRDLEAAKKNLAKYEADLATANDKAASRNVPAITQFLDNWKQHVKDFYAKKFERYPEAYRRYQEDLKQYEMDYFEERKLKKENYELWKSIEQDRREIKENFHACFGCITPYVERAYNTETYRYRYPTA